MARLFPLRTRFQRDVAEIENYFDTYARRHPGVSCTMLRYQPAIGPGLRTQITRYLSQPVCPTFLGFDPRIQLVGIDDALEAIVAAVRNPVPGAVNVAGPGTIGLARMIRLAGRRALPIAAPLFGAVTSAGQRLGLDAAVGGLPAAAALRPRRGHQAAHRRGGLHAAPVDRGGGRGLGGRASADVRHAAGAAAWQPCRRPRSTSCAACAPASTPASSCPRRSPAAPTALPRDARETVSADPRPAWTATTRRTSGASTRSFAELVEPFFAFLYETWWRVKVDRRRARARARPRAAHRRTTRGSCPGTPR